MKDLNVKVLDDKDNELVDLLNVAGIPKNMSRALILINNNKEATSREIELGAALRQPDVSIVTKEMVRRGWINVSENKTEDNKGRPKKVYKLIMSIADIVKELEANAAKKFAATTSTLSKLKSLSKV
jgi:predicted transcriptional regulator